MRLRSWPFVVVVLVVLVGVSGCSSTSPASPTSRGSPASSATAAPPTPSATPATGGVTVVATGAAASPTGTLVFVVVDNPSPAAASAVAINATAASANGGAPLHASALIPNLAAGERQAAVIPLTVPSGDSLGPITATAQAAGESTYTNPLTATQARFINDPINPSISVSVATVTSVPHAAVVAVCWVGANIVGGAINGDLAVPAGAAKTVTMQAALTSVPGSCSGYARPN
jgi:hypothetical protein